MPPKNLADYKETGMLGFDKYRSQIIGPGGRLDIRLDDEVARKLAMLIEGECGTESKKDVAAEHGFSRQRYFQVRKDFLEGGTSALCSFKRGPKKRSRRTDEAVRQIIRYRFLDPDITVDVIAQKLRQQGRPISISSVKRVVGEYGLQKKTLRKSSES